MTSPIRRIAPARPTAWTGPEPVQTGRARSLLAVVMAVLAFILFLSLVLWILAANLDEAPPVSTPGRVGYTALNQFSIAAVRSVARKATEFESNAAAI